MERGVGKREIAFLLRGRREGGKNLVQMLHENKHGISKVRLKERMLPFHLISTLNY